jgi:hypothetical protein
VVRARNLKPREAKNTSKPTATIGKKEVTCSFEILSKLA